MNTLTSLEPAEIFGHQNMIDLIKNTPKIRSTENDNSGLSLQLVDTDLSMFISPELKSDSTHEELGDVALMDDFSDNLTEKISEFELNPLKNTINVHSFFKVNKKTGIKSNTNQDSSLNDVKIVFSSGSGMRAVPTLFFRNGSSGCIQGV